MTAKRSKEDFENAVRTSFSIAEMCRNLGLKPCGGNYKLMHNAIDEYKLDTSHFRGQGWNIGLKFNPSPAKPINELLVKNSRFQSYKLKNRLIKEGLKKYLCECCGLSQWLGKTIPLELHHMNGDHNDNRIENLLLLCPNCHAMTDSYRGRNNKSGKVKK